jgi:hypothetical protein
MTERIPSPSAKAAVDSWRESEAERYLLEPLPDRPRLPSDAEQLLAGALPPKPRAAASFYRDEITRR